jgi:hypothetical protein
MNVETNSTTTIVNKIFLRLYLVDLRTRRHRTRRKLLGYSHCHTLIYRSDFDFNSHYIFDSCSLSRNHKRKISVNINTLGGSVEEILLNYWNGSHFKKSNNPLYRLLILLYYMHKIIRRTLFCIFHSSDKKEAFVLNITNLDEVLTVLLHNIPKEQQPSYNILMRLRKAISSYLVTLPATFITPGKKHRQYKF